MQCLQPFDHIAKRTGYDTSEQPKPDRDRTEETAQLPKTHQDFWRARLKKRTYRADGKLVEVPTWQVRLFHQSREEWFNLDSANKDGAAIKARDIYSDLRALGWE